MPLFAGSVSGNWTSTMLKIDVEREQDGRWIAEVSALPGVLAYGATAEEARAKVKVLALRVVADRLDNGEALPREIAAMFEPA
jgi:predicted RNase H-like HicB family nuclease